MTAAVYATDSARRYHATAACKALRNAQDLSDWDCWDDYCRHQHPKPNPIREMTVTDALGAGKWPCAACWPGTAAALAISASEDDFGHEPVSNDVDRWGETTDDPPVCARCAVTVRALVPVVIDVDMQGRRITEEQWISYPEPVRWPCTSAIVLGLVPRPD